MSGYHKKVAPYWRHVTDPVPPYRIDDGSFRVLEERAHNWFRKAHGKIPTEYLMDESPIHPKCPYVVRLAVVAVIDKDDWVKERDIREFAARMAYHGLSCLSMWSEERIDAGNVAPLTPTRGTV